MVNFLDHFSVCSQIQFPPAPQKQSVKKSYNTDSRPKQCPLLALSSRMRRYCFSREIWIVEGHKYWWWEAWITCVALEWFYPTWSVIWGHLLEQGHKKGHINSCYNPLLTVPVIVYRNDLYVFFWVLKWLYFVNFAECYLLRLCVGRVTPDC